MNTQSSVSILQAKSHWVGNSDGTSDGNDEDSGVGNSDGNSDG